MALLTAIVDIQDSAGTSLVPPNTDGTKPLKVLRVSDDFDTSYTKSGDTGIVSLSVATSLKVDTYIKATGSGGTAGLDVGRYGLDASGAIPGAFGIKNDDGSGYALLIDNGSSLTSSQWDFQVGGATGSKLARYALSFEATSGGSDVSIPSGHGQIWFNGTYLSVSHPVRFPGGGSLVAGTSTVVLSVAQSGGVPQVHFGAGSPVGLPVAVDMSGTADDKIAELYNALNALGLVST